MRSCLLFIIFLAWPLESRSDSELTTKLGLYSAHIFRGVELYDGMTIQSEISNRHILGKRSAVTGAVSAALPAQGERSQISYQEYNGQLAYEHKSGPATFHLGAVWYQLSEEVKRRDGNTGELFAQMALTSLLRPVFKLYQDVDESESRYFEMEFSHPLYSTPYDKSMWLTPKIRLGYAWGASAMYSSDGFNHTDFELEAGYELCGVTIRPTISYVLGDDSQAQDKLWAGARLEVVW